MLLRSGITVAFFTLISRFFGLARELFTAYTFGSTSVADCVNVAFKFPNLFRRIFGEGALSSVFIPTFNQKFVESPDKALKFSGEIFVLLLLCLIGLTLLLEILMPYLIFLIAPGFHKDLDKFNLAILLCRITTPYLIFISITALFGGMMNSIKKFAAFAFTPVIMNICTIIITIALRDTISEEYGISISLIITGILQVVFMYYYLVQYNITFPLSFNINDPDVIKFLKNMGPASIGSGTQQLNSFISQSIASFIPGAVSILSYADRLYQLPLSLIGISFSTILLPELSVLYKKSNFLEANFLQNKAIKIGMAITIPASFGLFTLSKPIIHLIYEHGFFSPEDTINTALVLNCFVFGLPAFILNKILTPLFYANHDTKTPLKISIYSLLTNSILNIILMIPFSFLGIAIGSSIAAWFNVWLLLKYTRRYGNFKIAKDTYLYCLKIILNTFIMTGFLVLAISNYGYYFYDENFLIKFIALFAIIIFAIFIFITLFISQKLHKELLGSSYEKDKF